jgi:hypothetical protein
MKLTIRIHLPGLTPGGTDEPVEKRERRKRFKRAMKDLEVDRPEHIVPLLEALLAANAAQLGNDDLSAITGDWLAADLRVQLVREHAERASTIADELAPLLERLLEIEGAG